MSEKREKRKVFHTFITDRLVRNADGIPICKIVLAGKYEKGEDIKVAVMEPLRVGVESLFDLEMYVDEARYMLDRDLPKTKITKYGGRIRVNNFILKKA
jgi:hypothetical protein